MADHRGQILATSPRRPNEENKPRIRIDDDSGIDSFYCLGNMLGKGAFGVVWEATKRTDEQQYAIKMVAKDKPGSMAIQLLEREIQVLNRVNHPHIIKLIEVFETQKKVFIVLEMCRGGELSDLLKEKKRFREEEVKTIMRRLAEAVKYMHDKDMVHRDLKLENILLSTADPNDQYNIKVTDFGLSHMKGLPGCDDLMSSRCGTLYYMAPEVLKNKHEYSKLCDVWSMGVIMYALLCGCMPFTADTASQLEAQVLNGELKFKEPEWISISEGAKELIRGMLHVSTIHRLTARQVLEDPWITGGASRKRIDPLKMLMDDSPSPSPPQTRTDSFDITSSLPTSIPKSDITPVKNGKVKQISQDSSNDSDKTFRSRSKSMGRSTSTGTARLAPPSPRNKSIPPSSKKVTTSVSTGRLQTVPSQSSRATTAHTNHRSPGSHTTRKLNSAKPN